MSITQKGLEDLVDSLVDKEVVLIPSESPVTMRVIDEKGSVTIRHLEPGQWGSLGLVEKEKEIEE